MSRADYYDLYWKQNLSVREIAKKLNTNYSRVIRDLARLGIELRNKEDAAKVRQVRKKDNDGA